MITRLSISNYALIRHIDLSLDSGFNVITGETGAGKSIMLGALGLLRGGRLTSRSALHPDAPARITAEFEPDARTAALLHPILDAAGVPTEGDALTLEREISPAGRSRARVNGHTVNLDVLQELSARLIDIHSQHANLLIASPDFQLDTLDRVADDAAELAAYRAIYADYRTALKEYSDRRDQIEATRRDADYIKFQYDRLDLAGLQAGELAELEAERADLAGRIGSSERLVRAAEALVWDDDAAIPSLDRAIAALEGLSDDPEATAVLSRLSSVRIELADISDSVSRRAASGRGEPRDLDAIDERISLISDLIARHGVASDADLVELRDNLGQRLRDLSDAPAVLGELKARAVELKRRALEAADAITMRRRAAADSLAATIMEQARPLAMPNLVCRIDVTPGKLNASGRDTVEWLFAFNKNQEPQPVGQTASGGEISRIMLVLKCILAGRIGLPTIIFDEIDTGVSGDVGARIGRLMADGASAMQLITITHLPQVAARGTRHFKVYKLDDDTSTGTYIAQLDADSRRRELAAMIAGKPDDPAALATADTLLSPND